MGQFWRKRHRKLTWSQFYQFWGIKYDLFLRESSHVFIKGRGKKRKKKGINKGMIQALKLILCIQYISWSEFSRFKRVRFAQSLVLLWSVFRTITCLFVHFHLAIILSFASRVLITSFVSSNLSWRVAVSSSIFTNENALRSLVVSKNDVQPVADQYL